MLQDPFDLRKIKPFTMRGTKRHQGFCRQDLFRGTFSYDFAPATGRKNRALANVHCENGHVSSTPSVLGTRRPLVQE